MSFTDSKYLELKAQTQNAVNALIIRRNQEQELKLRLESLKADFDHHPTIDKALEGVRLGALMDPLKNAIKEAYDRAIELTVKLSKTINKRIEKSNESEASTEAGVEMVFVERLYDVVLGKPQPPPPE